MPRTRKLRPTTIAIAVMVSYLAAGTAAQAGEKGDFISQQIVDGRTLAPDQRGSLYILDSNNPKWTNATINWYYNAQGQPADMNSAQVVAVIRNAMTKWENVCSVRFNYLGETTARPSVDGSTSSDGMSVIGWQAFTGSQAGFSGYTAWRYQIGASGSVMSDSDMVINTSNNPPFSAANSDALGALVTHEVGHMLAINHSDLVESIMYANPYHTFSYQSTIRGDDAAACAALYGYSATASHDRMFNWAEQKFPQFFAPVGASSQDAYGFHFRYFPSTGSYLGSKDGRIYYLPYGGGINDLVDLGDANQFWNSAVADGF